MRTQTAQRVVTLVGVAFLGLVFSVQAFAQASFPTVPRRTKNFDVSMVRAMDECTSPTLIVTSPNMPLLACPQTNTVTDDTLGMQKAKLRITKSGKVRLLGRGFAVGDTVRLRLTARTTRQNVTTNMGTGSVTFSDVTVDCPLDPNAIPVKLNGSISITFELGACFAPTTGLALGNIEILQARLVNVANGSAFAVPGVQTKP